MNAKPILVREVMTQVAERTAPHETLDRAAHRMRIANIGFLVVYSPAEGVVGVLTDRDIVVRATAEGRDPRTAQVREAMTAQVVTCRDDDELGEAVRRMEQKAIRRLVVLDREDRIVGVISVDDVARALGAEGLAGAVLRQAAQPVP